MVCKQYNAIRNVIRSKYGLQKSKHNKNRKYENKNNNLNLFSISIDVSGIGLENPLCYNTQTLKQTRKHTLLFTNVKQKERKYF